MLSGDVNVNPGPTTVSNNNIPLNALPFYNYDEPIMPSECDSSGYNNEPKRHCKLYTLTFVATATCKQRLLHGNEIVQYFQNYKCYNTDRDHFRKHL